MRETVVMSAVLVFRVLLVGGFLLTLQVVRQARLDARALGAEMLWLGVLVVAILLGNLIRVARGYGQGGALRETGSAEAPLTSSLADNTRWLWGVIYVNRDDPSIMVEERFGLGYTLNLGNRRAVLVLVANVALALGLVALGLFGSSIFGGV